jgi:uncharacterized protein (DUF1499 family)
MPERPAVAATTSAALGILALTLVALGPALVQIGAATPRAGFSAFALGLLIGLLGFLLGILALWSTRAGGGRGGRGRAWTGAAIGLVLTLLLVTAVAPGRGLPRINDITTNPDDPPLFSAAARAVENQGRDLSYPGAAFADEQRRAYPDLAPLRLDAPPARVVEDARRVAESLGWTVTAADPEAGVLEGYETSRTFRFVDDVVVRVRPAGSGSVVDVRSKSRDGRGDLGVNARRIRAFLSRLESPTPP